MSFWLNILIFYVMKYVKITFSIQEIPLTINRRRIRDKLIKISYMSNLNELAIVFMKNVIFDCHF